MIDFVLNKELVNFNKEFGFTKIYYINLVDIKDGNQLRDLKGFTAVRANDKLLRSIFENKKINLVLGLEDIEEKDSLHNRNSGLNHVLCNLAKKNNISIGFSFRDILYSSDREKLLGRIIQNVSLCKKYNVNIVFGSFAKDKYDMRMAKDLEAFGRLLGINKLDNEKIFKLKEFLGIKVV